MRGKAFYFFCFIKIHIFASTSAQMSQQTNCNLFDECFLAGCTERCLDLDECDKNVKMKSKLSLLIESGDKNLFLRRALDLSQDKKLFNLLPLRQFLNLQHLNLTGCFFLMSIEPLSKLRNLMTLYLGSCENISDFTPLSGKRILKLDLSCIQIEKKEKLSFLLRMDHLVSLDLSECFIGDGCMISLRNIKYLSRLRFLYLRMCCNVFDFNVRDIAGCPTLERLDLSFTNFSSACFKIMSMGNIARTLRSLNLDNVENINDDIGIYIKFFSCLEELSLRYTDVGDNTIIGLSYIIRLRKLDIAGCVYVRSLMPLCGKQHLIYLDISSCFGIKSLSVLPTLTNLEYLNISHCCSEINVGFLEHIRTMLKLRDLLMDSGRFSKHVRDNIDNILSRNRLSSRSVVI